ncbi:MAG: hypothetical protein JWM37_56 [Candidatus Saccharibacteria bacterium]|nr:hypothetical protein [Candidatus Saccharibacteria bacterium]
MNTIVIATQNEGKIQAVRDSLQTYGPQYGWNDDFTLIGVESESGISVTPSSDEEGLLGCENRIAFAREQQPGAFAYIALEGIMAQARNRSYIRGWTMIDHPGSGRTVSASGASVEVPAYIAELAAGDQELSYIVQAHYPLDEPLKSTLRNVGANGAFTTGEYGRHDSFFDGVRICLALLANSSNWRT